MQNKYYAVLDTNVMVSADSLPEKAAAHEKAQLAVDKFFADNNIGIKEIEDMLNSDKE